MKLMVLALVLLVALLLLPSCAVTPSNVAEVTYQSLEAIDYAQTLNVVRRPDCLQESGPAHYLIGHHPDNTKLALYTVGMMGSHFLVTNWLNREIDATDAEGWKAVLVVWQLGSIAFESQYVIHNFKLGSEPFGHNLTALCHEHGFDR